jgi:hypothetical protein
MNSSSKTNAGSDSLLPPMDLCRALVMQLPSALAETHAWWERVVPLAPELVVYRSLYAGWSDHTTAFLKDLESNGYHGPKTIKIVDILLESAAKQAKGLACTIDGMVTDALLRKNPAERQTMYELLTDSRILRALGLYQTMGSIRNRIRMAAALAREREHRQQQQHKEEKTDLDPLVAGLLDRMTEKELGQDLLKLALFPPASGTINPGKSYICSDFWAGWRQNESLSDDDDDDDDEDDADKIYYADVMDEVDALELASRSSSSSSSSADDDDGEEEEDSHLQ